jgi:hypothetical protein
VGLLATAAYAVAGKIVNPPAGVAVAGGSLTLELTDPLPDGQTEITVPVDQQGGFEVPPTVDQKKLKTCRYKDSKGDTHLLPCGVLFFGGGGAGTAVATAPAGEFASMFGTWVPRIDATLAAGFAFGLSDTDGFSKSPFNRTTKSVDHLSGAAYSFTVRGFLPYKPLPKTSLWLFGQYDYFDNVKGTGGKGDHHIPTPGEETEFTNQVKQSFGFGIGENFQIGDGFYIGAKQGGAVVWQTLTGHTDETGGGGKVETFRQDSTNLVPLLGLWVSKQLGDSPVSFVVGSDWRYLPSGGVDGRSSLSFPYHFEREGQWMMNVYGGFNIPLFDTGRTW